MDVDDEEEFSEVCKRHFEEAMKFARRSVSDQVMTLTKVSHKDSLLNMPMARFRTSRSTRCSRRHYSSKEALETISASLSQAAVELAEIQVQEVVLQVFDP